MTTPTPDFGSPTLSGASANFSTFQPVSPGQMVSNVWNGSGADSLFHNLTGSQGTDFSKGQIAPGAYASGPTQNTSPAPNYSSAPNASYSFGNPNSPDLSNPVKQTDYNNYLKQAQQAAQSGNSALLSQLNTQFDQNAAKAQNQLGFLGTQRDNALGSLNTDFTNTQNLVGNQRSDAQQNADDQINQAGSVAHSTQMQNRNVLRALGILNSSAAGDMLTKPINEFDTQRAAVNTQLGQRFRDLDTFLNDQVAKHADAVKQIQDNYGNLVGNIQSDLRFNDRQRADAIQAANAALQQHLADIQSSVLNYANQVNQQKQQLALGVAQIMAYRNPSYDPTGIINSAIQTSGDPTQMGINIFQDPNQKKNTLSGL